MEQTTKPANGKAMQHKERVLVVVITNCEFESYWYHGWNGATLNVIELDDHFVLHTDWADGKTPYRMIDKGDADIIGRLTPTPEEELIFSERLAHDPKAELTALMGKKVADVVDKTAQAKKEPVFKIPGERMDAQIIGDARNNIEDLFGDTEIAKALADIYGMRAALEAVMMWFNKDCVTTPQWIYELVFSRINKSDSYGFTNKARASIDIDLWKKDFPKWAEQEKEVEHKLTKSPFMQQLDEHLLKNEHEMLLRLGDYLLGNFPERDFAKENVVSFVIRLLEELKRRRSETSDHASDAFRYAMNYGGRNAGKTYEHEMTKTRLDGYETIKEFLDEHFCDQAQGETAAGMTIRLLKDLLNRRKLDKTGVSSQIVKQSDQWTNLRDYIILNWKVKSEAITFDYVRDMLARLLNYEKINKLQGMPLHPLLQLNEQLADFLLKEFPNDPGRMGKEEQPIEVAIRLLTEYAQGWNVAEGILHFLGWFTMLEHAFDFGTRHNPRNMVPLVKSFVHAHRLPDLRHDPEFYLRSYTKEKA